MQTEHSKPPIPSTSGSSTWYTVNISAALFPFLRFLSFGASSSSLARISSTILTDARDITRSIGLAFRGITLGGSFLFCPPAVVAPVACDNLELEVFFDGSPSATVTGVTKQNAFGWGCGKGEWGRGIIGHPGEYSQSSSDTSLRVPSGQRAGVSMRRQGGKKKPNKLSTWAACNYVYRSSSGSNRSTMVQAIPHIPWTPNLPPSRPCQTRPLLDWTMVQSRVQNWFITVLDWTTASLIMPAKFQLKTQNESEGKTIGPLSGLQFYLQIYFEFLIEVLHTL
jgi:hypothetical protein